MTGTCDQRPEFGNWPTNGDIMTIDGSLVKLRCSVCSRTVDEVVIIGIVPGHKTYPTHFMCRDCYIERGNEWLSPEEITSGSIS